MAVSGGGFTDWKEGNTSFEALSVVRGVDMNLSGEGQPEGISEAELFLDAKVFGGWLERHPVNPLFGQLYWIKADIVDLVALLLHGDVKPILLLHGVALALVVTRCVSLLGLLLRGVMERFADDDPARRACGGGERIAIGKFATQICAART